MEKGFTLIETLFVLGILSITAMLTIGPYEKFMAKQQVISDIQSISSSIALARSEAIANRQNIILCGLDSNSNCSRNWLQLAIIQQVTEHNKVINTTTLSGNYKKILWSSFQRKKYLKFTPYGFTNHQNGSLYLCHKKHPDLHRIVVVSKSARVSVKSLTKNHHKCN